LILFSLQEPLFGAVLLLIDIECKQYLHYSLSVNATIYGRGQMVIPAKARKQAGIDTGDIVSVEPEGDGRLVLVRLERPNPRQHQIHLRQRKGRHSILTGGPTVNMEQVRASLSGLR